VLLQLNSCALRSLKQASGTTVIAQGTTNNIGGGQIELVAVQYW